MAGNLRVRHHGELARVEMDLEELDRWLDLSRAATLRDAVRAAGFARVSVDLRGFRSGSLNIRSATATELELTDPMDSASLSRT